MERCSDAGEDQGAEEAFGAATYSLGSEEALAAAEASSFVHPLLAELEAMLDGLRPSLTPDNLDSLLLLLLTLCTERLEALLMTKRVSVLGALQLERDVRTFGKRLGEISSRSVRDKLSRLSQIVTLLNLEREVEVLDITSHGGLRLSAAEIRQVLLLRVEFRKETIAQLRL